MQMLDFKGFHILLITGRFENKRNKTRSMLILTLSYRMKVLISIRPAEREQVSTFKAIMVVIRSIVCNATTLWLGVGRYVSYGMKVDGGSSMVCNAT